jgi:hypothetical protein
MVRNFNRYGGHTFAPPSLRQSYHDCDLIAEASASTHNAAGGHIIRELKVREMSTSEIDSILTKVERLSTDDKKLLIKRVVDLLGTGQPKPQRTLHADRRRKTGKTGGGLRSKDPLSTRK